MLRARWLFSFGGGIGRSAYAASSLGVFFSQHLVVWLAFSVSGARLPLSWSFYVAPLRTLVFLPHGTIFLLLAGLAYLLLVAWVLAALAFRRAADAQASPWIAAPVIAPFLQVPAILLLCLMPTRIGSEAGSTRSGDQGSDWAAAAQGVVAGMGLTLIAVFLGALVFGTYGFGMFVVSPFVIGATTGYLANRRQLISAERTVGLVVAATGLGAVALVVAALEGVVCIVVASPLGLGAALLGGAFGRESAVRRSATTGPVYSIALLLPIMFGIEDVLPASTEFDTEQKIEIEAPPNLVWQSILHMETMDEPLALPFRLGVAYPLRGEVIGEGVGAVRHGEFSTGVALERVTEWVVERKLAFIMLNEVPAMRELSPYEHVHAPHIEGYFLTRSTSFELVPIAGGRTQLVERTAHELRLDPVLYWLPIARWAVDENNARVLAHIRRQAERR
jgi:uncharacterized membrane protein YhaH (DUF805 family)